MSDGKYGGQYDQHDGNCLVCGRMLNKKNECSLCDSIEAPLLNRIEALEAEVAELTERLAQFEFVDVEYFGSDYSTEVHVYHGPALLEEK